MRSAPSASPRSWSWSSTRRSPSRSRTCRSPTWSSREGRALVIALNKWDLIDDRQETLAELREEAERLLPQLARRAAGAGLGADRRGHRQADGGGASRTHEVWNRRVPTARAQPLARRRSSSAIRRRPSPAAGSSSATDPGQGAAADLRRLLLAARGAAGSLSPLSRQRPARGLRPARRADPADAAERREPVRRQEAEGAERSEPVQPEKRVSVCAGKSNSTPFSSKSGESIRTMSGTSASGRRQAHRVFAGHGLGAHPVRIGPGSKRLTRALGLTDLGRIGLRPAPRAPPSRRIGAPIGAARLRARRRSRRARGRRRTGAAAGRTSGSGASWR